MSNPNIIQDIVDIQNNINVAEHNINDIQTFIQNIGSNIINLIYPVGSIYMSVNNVSPATFLGGTWEQIQDKFLLSAGSTYSGGTTGGSSSHKHTLSENGGATIRKYASQFIMGRITTAGNMPNSVGSLGNDGSWWITNANGDTATKK